MATTEVRPRIQIIDALRGFSLAGIVIVHIVENYVGAPSPEGTMTGTHTGVLDAITDGFIFLFLRGKFFALFSFLFGLSFFLQINGAEKRGQDLRVRFLWRLFLLLAIGYVHSLFYRGDILTVYAILGTLLILFYKVQNRWILTLTALLFLGIGRFLFFWITHGDSPFIPGALTPGNPIVLDYFQTIDTGSLTDVFLSNAIDGHLMKMDFQLGIFSRGYLTFGFFLLGMYAGRICFFENFRHNKKLIQRILIWAVIAFFVFMGLTAYIFAQLGPEVTFDNWTAMLGLSMVDLSNIAMTVMLISVFIICYRKAWGQKLLDSFVPYGRMALTNYFFQSIIGTFIFFGWGMGYLGEIPNRYSFIIAIILIILQMILSTWWLKKFRYGPLEWLWRSATYFKKYPLKR